MRDLPKPWSANPPAPQAHQIMTLGGEIYYASGSWGEKLRVGDNFIVTVTKCNAILTALPIVEIASAETNINGEFILKLITYTFNIKRHRLLLTVSEKDTLKKAYFDLVQLVNLQLTSQSQFIPPLIVSWGP